MKPSFCAACIRETAKLQSADYLGRAVWLCDLCSKGYEDPRYRRYGEHAECPRGHAFTEENTHYYRGKYRRCRQCNRDSMRKRDRARSAARSGRAATPSNHPELLPGEEG